VRIDAPAGLMRRIEVGAVASSIRLGEVTNPNMSSERGQPRTGLTLALATVGLGLNLRATVLLGPHLHDRFGAGPRSYMLAVALPLLVAVIVRLPVGVLTDRFGARVMFPVVSLAAAVPVFGLAIAGSVPELIVAGTMAGVGGAAFVVGASLVTRTVSYGRRGLALGVFSVGPAVAVLISAASRGVDPGGRVAAVVLGGLLVIFAGVAARALRDERGRGHGGSPMRRCLETARLAATASLSLLHALALGGIAAMAVFLPMYLTSVFHLGWFRALAVTGGVIAGGAAGRLLGGWWTDRRPTTGLLVGCYSLGAVLCLVVAAAPGQWWLSVPAIAATGICDGVASGALLALIGKAARPGAVGAVMGAAGAAAAVGTLAIPLLLGAVDIVSHSYTPAWILLAVVLSAGARYVRTHGLRVGLGLPVRLNPEPSPTATTVAVVAGAQVHLGATAAVVGRLAELAMSDELIVVYGAAGSSRPRRTPNVLLDGLRYRLPRHQVVAVSIAVTAAGDALGLAAPLSAFVEAGTVPIAVTPAAVAHDVAAHMCSYLRADRLLMVRYTTAIGAGLDEVWRRGRSLE
jgi:NNP family nitrate/nitrite transporter-like MFS transporter